MRSLPRASASPAFTREVMRKLHSEEAAPEHGLSRPWFWRAAAGFAMAACLFAFAQLAVRQQRQEARTLALQAERQQLAEDLEAVKQIASDAEPVLVLEKDQGTRVIVDIDSAIQPVSTSHYD